MTDQPKIKPLPLLGKDDPRLREKSLDVPVGEDRRELVGRMLATMVAYNGIGLSAIQVGVAERIIIGANKDFSFCILNPVLARHGKDRQWYREGCLSLPRTFVGRRRFKLVVVTGFDINWNPVEIQARKLMAQVIQHELDHLDGILMTDQDEWSEELKKREEARGPRVITPGPRQVQVVAPGLGLVRRPKPN